jgi:hypothetical protein
MENGTYLLVDASARLVMRQTKRSRPAMVNLIYSQNITLL